jgi:mono/diheme cytochrome c family protein
MVKTLVFALWMIMALTACGPKPPAITYDQLPVEGNAESGEALFKLMSSEFPPCTGCHIAGATGSPPLEEGFGQITATRVEGQSAREYIFYSLVDPARHIVEGYGNAMYDQYDDKMTPQQIADLIAYLSGL